MLKQMEAKLQKEFEPTVCKIVDPYGDMNSITITVHSSKFKGMLPLARHRAINELLKEEIQLIHAV
jgi:stress-induced morphogen